MTATEKPESTAVATRPAQTPSAYTARERAGIAAEATIARLSWGKDIEDRTAQAVVLWCRRHDIDPVTEMDVLGNKPCPNAKWYARKIGALIGKGLEGLSEDQVQDIPDDLPAYADQETKDWTAKERNRRFRERTLYGIPHEAVGACVVRIKLRGLDEISGASWAGGKTAVKIASGGVLKRGAEADPIGEAFPVESAVTRAYRKAGRVLAAHLPALGEALEMVEVEGETIAATIREEGATNRALAADIAAVGRGPLTPSQPGDPDYIRPGLITDLPPGPQPVPAPFQGKTVAEYLGPVALDKWTDVNLAYAAKRAGEEGQLEAVDLLHAEMERRRTP